MPEQHQLKGLYENQRYEEVATFFEDAQEREQFSEWDFFHCMNSMYKLKRYSDCIEVYRAAHKKYPTFDKLDDRVGWSLYHTQIKSFDVISGNIQQLIEQVDYILAHNSGTEFSPCWAIIKKLLEPKLLEAIHRKKLEQKTKDQIEQYTKDHLANDYLDAIDPMNLSEKEGSMIERNDTKRQLASDRERWFSKKTKILLEIKEFEQCISVANRALHTIKKFHNNNDSWFIYRKAKSEYALGNIAKAAEHAQSILNTRLTHWCVYELLFIVNRDIGNYEKALKYGAICSLSDHEHKMRVNFYDEFADFLVSIGKTEQGMMHRQLSVLLRAGNGWSPRRYQTKWQVTEDVAGMDKNAVLTALTPFWKELRDKDKVYHEGVVGRLLPSGNDGFIIDNANSSYYFRLRDVRGSRAAIIPGASVRFTLIDGFDKKKNRKTRNAAEIEVVG